MAGDSMPPPRQCQPPDGGCCGGPQPPRSSSRRRSPALPTGMLVARPAAFRSPRTRLRPGSRSPRGDRALLTQLATDAVSSPAGSGSAGAGQEGLPAAPEATSAPRAQPGDGRTWSMSGRPRRPYPLCDGVHNSGRPALTTTTKWSESCRAVGPSVGPRCRRGRFRGGRGGGTLEMVLSASRKPTRVVIVSAAPPSPSPTALLREGGVPMDR
jgi:hypothetical protein